MCDGDWNLTRLSRGHVQIVACCGFVVQLHFCAIVRDRITASDTGELL